MGLPFLELFTGTCVGSPPLPPTPSFIFFRFPFCNVQEGPLTFLNSEPTPLFCFGNLSPLPFTLCPMPHPTFALRLLHPSFLCTSLACGPLVYRASNLAPPPIFFVLPAVRRVHIPPPPVQWPVFWLGCLIGLSPTTLPQPHRPTSRLERIRCSVPAPHLSPPFFPLSAARSSSTND